MNAKIMEGLVGAGMNMDLISTPFRVYKEASRRGDTAAMERAMGYVTEFSCRAEVYSEKAAEGTEEDAEAAREKERSEREQAIQRRREEQDEFEEKLEENRSENEGADVVVISEEGKALLKESGMADDNGSDSSAADGNVSVKSESTADKIPVIYIKTGERKPALQTESVSVSALV